MEIIKNNFLGSFHYKLETNCDIIKDTTRPMIYRADKKETKKGRRNSAQFAVTSKATYPRVVDGFSNSSH